MRLPNPNQNKPFDKVYNDQHGLPLYGIRNPNTTDEEVVDIRSGTSNQTYYQPDTVMNPQGCGHEFTVVNMGKREAECRNCQLPITFIPFVNFKESKGTATITIKNTSYPVIS